MVPFWTLCQHVRLNTPEEFENGIFTLKTHEMFSFHTKPGLSRGNLKIQQSPVMQEKLCQGHHVIIVSTSFSENSVFKTFSAHTKTKSRRFQIPPV